MAPCERQPPRQGVAAKNAAESRRVHYAAVLLYFPGRPRRPVLHRKAKRMSERFHLNDRLRKFVPNIAR